MRVKRIFLNHSNKTSKFKSLLILIIFRLSNVIISATVSILQHSQYKMRTQAFWRLSNCSKKKKVIGLFNWKHFVAFYLNRLRNLMWNYLVTTFKDPVVLYETWAIVSTVSWQLTLSQHYFTIARCYQERDIKKQRRHRANQSGRFDYIGLF